MFFSIFFSFDIKGNFIIVIFSLFILLKYQLIELVVVIFKKEYFSIKLLNFLYDH